MRYSSQREYLRVGQAVVAAVLALVAYVAVVKPKEIFVGYPRGFVPVPLPASVPIIYGLLMLVFLGAVRYAVRMYFERPLGGYRARRGARSVLIVGAGDGGRLLLREILRNPDLNMRPVGFVDDDPRKQGVRIDRGLDVLGTTEDLSYVLEDVEPDEVLIAIPSAPGTLRARVVRACRERGVRVRTMPTVFELLQTGGGRFIRQVREVRVEDVLGREPVRMEIECDGRLPDRPLRDGHGRGRLDRRRAVPPDRARGPEPARRCSTTPRTTCSRSRASWSRTGTRSTPSRCSPTARRRSACGRCSRSTARPSSSTRPPTSTWG